MVTKRLGKNEIFSISRKSHWILYLVREIWNSAQSQRKVRGIYIILDILRFFSTFIKRLNKKKPWKICEAYYVPFTNCHVKGQWNLPLLQAPSLLLTLPIISIAQILFIAFSALNCNKLYIDETGRRLGDRIRDHLYDIRKSDQSKPF